jgi:hypothetical protein
MIFSERLHMASAGRALIAFGRQAFQPWVGFQVECQSCPLRYHKVRHSSKEARSMLCSSTDPHVINLRFEIFRSELWCELLSNNQFFDIDYTAALVPRDIFLDSGHPRKGEAAACMA